VRKSSFEIISDTRLGGHTLADCLEWAAALVQSQSSPVNAARLFGAAEAQREKSGAVRYAPEQHAYEHDLARLRTALAEPALEAAWAEGRELTREQAIRMAVDRPE
jgi:hypothetical protein